MQIKQLPWKWILCALITTTLYAGCKNDNLIRPGDTIDVAYKKGLRLYQNENYTDAAKAFETVINIGRGTDYAQSSYFYAAESYFENGQYLLAANGYERFITLYPRAPKRQTAAYKEALSYYKLSPRYRIDQKYTKQAIEKFRIFISRYPDSEKSEQAAEYLSQMRSKLAKKHYHSAELYMRTLEYEAAIIYYNLIIEQFPETSWAERALVDEIAAHVVYAQKSVTSKQRERYEKAVESYEKYIQLFPEGRNRQRAEANVDDARSALADLTPVVEDDQTTSADQK